MNPVKVFEVRLDAGNGGFDFNKFDVPDVDGFFYVIGYIAATAFGRNGRLSPKVIEEANRLEPDHAKGFEHGMRVRNAEEKKPSWHSTEIDILSMFCNIGVIGLPQLVEILHQRAHDAGRHTCKHHESHQGAKECEKDGFTGNEVLKA